MVLEKTVESPLGCKEIHPVHPKVNQSWIFIGRTDVEAETPILWPHVVKNWLIWKDPDAGKDWRWEEKGTTEDEMIGWHHQLNGHEFEQALGIGDEQGRLDAAVHGVAKSQTRLSDWNELNCTMSFFQSCALPPFLCFLLFSWAPSGSTMLPLQHSGGTTRK